MASPFLRLHALSLLLFCQDLLLTALFSLTTAAGTGGPPGGHEDQRGLRPAPATMSPAGGGEPGPHV